MKLLFTLTASSLKYLQSKQFYWVQVWGSRNHLSMIPVAAWSTENVQ